MRSRSLDITSEATFYRKSSGAVGFNSLGPKANGKPFVSVRPLRNLVNRGRFIMREETGKLLTSIIALARNGGLRCPSEVLSLRLRGIDWAAERIVVRSPFAEKSDTPQLAALLKTDGEGFEPPVGSLLQQFSRLPP